jgi:CBS domain-containing protein
MICPFCNFDNIDGIDSCEQCLMDLSSLDEPQGETPIENSLIREPVECLGPTEAVMVGPGTSVRDAIEVLVAENIGCVLVGQNRRVDGIFSERDLLLKVSGRLDDVGDHPVSEFMTRHPEMLEINAPLAFALNKMSTGDFRHLPLTRNGRLAGVVSLRDFLGFVFRWYPELAPRDA